MYEYSTTRWRSYIQPSPKRHQRQDKLAMNKLQKLKEIIIKANPEIIGRPITLANVLISIENKLGDNIIASSILWEIYMNWDLTKTLNDQKPETIDLLLDILGRKLV